MVDRYTPGIVGSGLPRTLQPAALALVAPYGNIRLLLMRNYRVRPRLLLLGKGIVGFLPIGAMTLQAAVGWVGGMLPLETCLLAPVRRLQQAESRVKFQEVGPSNPVPSRRYTLGRLRPLRPRQRAHHPSSPSHPNPNWGRGQRTSRASYVHVVPFAGTLTIVGRRVDGCC